MVTVAFRLIRAIFVWYPRNVLVISIQMRYFGPLLHISVRRTDFLKTISQKQIFEKMIDFEKFVFESFFLKISSLHWNVIERFSISHFKDNSRHF